MTRRVETCARRTFATLGFLCAGIAEADINSSFEYLLDRRITHSSDVGIQTGSVSRTKSHAPALEYQG